MATKKAATKKPVKKATTKKATKTEGETIRLKVFRLLAKKPMTGPQVRDALGVGGIPTLLKDEGVCPKPRIKRAVVEGQRGVVYSLTAAGKKALTDGTVDANAAPPSAGKSWPE